MQGTRRPLWNFNLWSPGHYPCAVSQTTLVSPSEEPTITAFHAPVEAERGGKSFHSCAFDEVGSVANFALSMKCSMRISTKPPSIHMLGCLRVHSRSVHATYKRKRWGSSEGDAEIGRPWPGHAPRQGESFAALSCRPLVQQLSSHQFSCTRAPCLEAPAYEAPFSQA